LFYVDIQYLFSTGLMSVVPTCNSRDYLTSSFAVFPIWWYFVKRHRFQVFAGNVCCNYVI